MPRKPDRVRPGKAGGGAKKTLKARFAAANVTGDGHLTLEPARGKMPMVAREFAAIDTAGKGYVTIEEIRAYREAHPPAAKGGEAAAES